MPSRDNRQNKKSPHGIPWGLSFCVPGCHLKQKTPLYASVGRFLSRGINTLQRQQNVSGGFLWLPGCVRSLCLASGLGRVGEMGGLHNMENGQKVTKKLAPFFTCSRWMNLMPAPKSPKSPKSPDAKSRESRGGKSRTHSRKSCERK